MKTKEVNKIMENIFEDESLCIIREALTQFESESEDKKRVDEIKKTMKARKEFGYN